jgi:hypothetical protein
MCDARWERETGYDCIFLNRNIKPTLRGTEERTTVVAAMVQRIKSRLNAQRTQSFEDFDGDRLIHTCAREGMQVRTIWRSRSPAHQYRGSGPWCLLRV